MEISRNKLILYIIAWLLAFFLASILLIMFIWNKNKWPKTINTADFVIWTVWDIYTNSTNLTDDFKKKAWINWNVIIKSFSSYDDYSSALSYALNSWTWPDIFVLNNNEAKTVFENNIIWIDPSIVNPNDFRKNYKSFITDQLIAKNDKEQEYLIWLPVWYEALWIFYNRKFVKAEDVSSLDSLNNFIRKLRQDFPDVIPIWIWNWTTVPYSEDIFTQLMLSEWAAKNFNSIDSQRIQWAVAEYTNFWDTQLENKYNEKYLELSASKQNSIDLFANGETFMVVWYPKLINEISKKWFWPSFLQATTFPTEWRNWASLINYNYFVLNKYSNKLWIAQKFISYLSSIDWMKKYFETFPYYIPASNALEKEMTEQNIHDKYKITISDFFNPTYNYTWFDKWMISFFDREIRKILDNPVSAVDEITSLQEKISCKSWKIFNLSNIDKSCE